MSAREASRAAMVDVPADRLRQSLAYGRQVGIMLWRDFAGCADYRSPANTGMHSPNKTHVLTG